jgi:hypothetical protein
VNIYFYTSERNIKLVLCYYNCMDSVLFRVPEIPVSSIPPPAVQHSRFRSKTKHSACQPSAGAEGLNVVQHVLYVNRCLDVRRGVSDG